MKHILVINPGSTSTKIGVFQQEKLIIEHNFTHSDKELNKYDSILDQIDFRKKIILFFLKENQLELNSFEVIMARGGLLKPLESGIYQINSKMIHDLQNASKQHASNIAALIADKLAKSIGVNAYIADPVVVDELQPIARFSGHPDFPRKSIFHALNQKVIARTYAKEIGESYENLNLIVVHMGGGITIGAHKKGKVIDVNQGYDGEGSFSPERSGTLPIGDVIKAAYSGSYTQQELHEKVVGKGGIVAYLKTNDLREVETNYLSGDEKSIAILDAMSYQISKEIGATAVVLKGKVDAIILTGGVAYCSPVTNFIEEQTNFIAPVKIYPGEDELKALALSGVRLLEDNDIVKNY